MKHIKFYFFALFYVLFAHVTSHASDLTQKQQEKLNKDLFDMAGSKTITPQEKHSELASLLEKKADITATRQMVLGGTKKVQSSALAVLMFVAYQHKRDDNESIKLLIESKSPLNSWHSGGAPLRIAIKSSDRCAIIPMLVAAKVDIDLLPDPAGGISKGTYLHDLAEMASKGDKGDTDAHTIFRALSPLGNVPLDNLDEYDQSAMHLSQSRRDLGFSKPLFAGFLAGYGANPYCSIDRCSTCNPFDPRVIAAHNQWKDEADRQVFAKIPVKPVKNLVIGYCFGK